MEKINLGMSFMEMISVMSEGNPGAITVLAEIIKADPITGVIKILNLDSLDIRGSKIWMLYKDCCGQDMDKFFRTLDFIRGGAYTSEEIDLNFQQVHAKPFMSDDVKEEDYLTEEDNGSISPWSENWNEYVQAHRATIIPKLEEFKKRLNEDEGLKF